MDAYPQAAPAAPSQEAYRQAAQATPEQKRSAILWLMANIGVIVISVIVLIVLFLVAK